MFEGCGGSGLCGLSQVGTRFPRIPCCIVLGEGLALMETWRRLAGQKTRHKHFVCALKIIVEPQTCLVVHVIETAPALGLLFQLFCDPEQLTLQTLYMTDIRNDTGRQTLFLPAVSSACSLSGLCSYLFFPTAGSESYPLQARHHMHRQQLSTHTSPLMAIA